MSSRQATKMCDECDFCEHGPRQIEDELHSDIMWHLDDLIRRYSRYYKCGELLKEIMIELDDFEQRYFNIEY